MVAASSYMQVQTAALYRRGGPTRRGDGSPVHLAEDAYGLTKEEREWLRTLYNRYRQDPLHEDALRELVWSIDRESMDDAQLRAKVCGIVPTGIAAAGGNAADPSWAAPAAAASHRHNTPSVTSSPSVVVSPRTSDVLAGRSAYTAATNSNADAMQAPTVILSFEQLMDYAVMVKTQCAQSCMSNQMTLDAFVLLGGHEDGTGEVQVDTLRQTITEFCLNIDVEAFVAAVDKDGDGTISFDEFAWLYNEGLAEVTSPASIKSPSVYSPMVANGSPADPTQADIESVAPTSTKEGMPRVGRLTIVETMAALVRGANNSVSVRSHSMAEAAYHHAAALTPSKRRVAAARTRPPAVHIHDLHEAHEALDCLEDVATTHESRMAYVESLNRKHVVEATQQGNHLLAEHLTSMLQGYGTEHSGVFGTPCTPAPRGGRKRPQHDEAMPAARSGPPASPRPPIPPLSLVVAQRLAQQRAATAPASSTRQELLSTAKHLSPRQRTVARRGERDLAIQRQEQAVTEAMSTLQSALVHLQQLKRPTCWSKQRNASSLSRGNAGASLQLPRAAPAMPTDDDGDADTYGEDDFEREEADGSTANLDSSTSRPPSRSSSSPSSASSASSSTFTVASSHTHSAATSTTPQAEIVAAPKCASAAKKPRHPNSDAPHPRRATPVAASNLSTRATNPKPLRCRLSLQPSPPPRTASFADTSRGRLHSAQARLVRSHDDQFTAMVARRNGTSAQLAVTPRVVADAIKRSVAAEDVAAADDRHAEPHRPAAPRRRTTDAHEATQMDRWTRH